MSPTVLATGSETILLVEDEQNVRDLARSVLERRGYTFLAACDGEEALHLSKDHAGDIQLMITDAIMLGMRWRELGKVIQKLRVEIKVLLISGDTDDAAIDQRVKEFSFCKNLSPRIHSLARSEPCWT